MTKLIPILTLIATLILTSCNNRKEEIVGELQSLGIKHMYKMSVPQLDSYVYLCSSADSLDQRLSMAAIKRVRMQCDSCYIFSFAEVHDWTEVGEEELTQMLESGHKSGSVEL